LSFDPAVEEGTIRGMNLTSIVRQLEAERDRLDFAINALRGVNGNPGGRKRRTMSAAARKKIAAAQKAMGKSESRKEMNHP